MKNWKKSLAIVSALTMITTATASLNLSATAVTNDIYEFEDGTLDGATVYTGDKDGNTVADASGDLVFLENSGETATVTVTVAETGMYTLTIATYTPYGNKTHNLLINGVDQGQISFEKNTTGSQETVLGMYKLTEGENTITIKSSWGWTYLDYLKVTDAELTELSVEKTLSDSNATDETKRLMCYLVDVYGNNILSGQQEIYMYGPHDFEYEFEYIKDLTGYYPAIRGFDFLNQANILYGSDDGTTDRMIDWANNKGGIVTASWHVTVPKDFENYELGVTSVDWSNATYAPDETDFDTANAIVEGTKEYEYYMACLESLASCIQELQDAGVPIILRPLHEAEGSGGETGSWFWWGKAGSTVYKELWKLTYTTLTETYGLHNIIWEWNSYAYSTSTDWYPGDEYVDIVAYDKYNCTDWSTSSAVLTHNDSAISGTFYNLVDMYGGKKMVAMSENDSIPTLENILTEKAGWLYFCPWYDGGSDDTNFLTNEVFNTKEDLITMYQSDYCINLEELPEDLYSSYSLEGFVDSEPKTTDPDVTTVTTATTTTTTENVVTYTIDDFTETADGYLFTVDNPENIEKIEILATISTTDESSWYCAGGGVVFGINEDSDYAFIDYQFNKGDSNVTVTIDGTFKSGELDDDGNNIETTGYITSNEIEITKWWTASENEGEDAVTLDITGVKVYYSTSDTTTTQTTTDSTTNDTTTDETTVSSDTTSSSVSDTTDSSVTTTVTEDTQDTTTTTTVGSNTVLLGDANGDGSVSGLDLILLKQYVLGIVDEDDIIFDNSDVNNDGSISGLDLILVKQYVLGLIDTL